MSYPGSQQQARKTRATQSPYSSCLKCCLWRMATARSDWHQCNCIWKWWQQSSQTAQWIGVWHKLESWFKAKVSPASRILWGPFLLLLGKNGLVAQVHSTGSVQTFLVVRSWQERNGARQETQTHPSAMLTLANGEFSNQAAALRSRRWKHRIGIVLHGGQFVLLDVVL